MEQISQDEGVTKNVSASATINEVKPETREQNKGVTNPGMDYETAMKSPTEHLAPEAFLEDLNGNAMSLDDNKKDTVQFSPGKRSRCNVRCLVFALIVFIIMTAVMAGLFAWRVVSFTETKTKKPPTPCYIREKPVPFDKLPIKIEKFLERMGEGIKSILKRDLSKGNIAMTNVVYYDKVIWQENYTVNNSKIQKITNYPVFPVASLTKVFTSLLAFKLYNDGNIRSLDDSIKKYEPEFSIANPFDNDNGEKITIRQLVSYESGLPREAPCYPDNKENFCPHNHSYIMKTLKKSKVLFSPGSDVLYGNLQFALAGHALSKNYSGGYKQLVHDKVLAPLGMRSSYFNLNDSIEKKIYTPVFVNGESQSLRKWGWLDPAGGLLTTVDDIAKFEIVLFNNNESGFLKPAVLDEFFSPVYFYVNEETMTGSPWLINFEKGYSIFVKDGYVYGYTNMIFINPHLRLALNVFSTSNDVVLKLFKEKTMHMLTNLFHDELKKLSKKTMLKGVPNPEKFVGVYNTTEVPTLLNQKIRISTSKIVNGNDHILAITLSRFTFDLTYVVEDVFEMIHKQCTDFGLGVNRERIYFKGSMDSPNKIDKFIIYGIHLRGKATFHREI